MTDFAGQTQEITGEDVILAYVVHNSTVGQLAEDDPMHGIRLEVVKSKLQPLEGGVAIRIHR